MNSSEYWIYSEENAGQAILAKCQGTAYLVLVTTLFESLVLLPLLIDSVNVDSVVIQHVQYSMYLRRNTFQGLVARLYLEQKGTKLTRHRYLGPVVRKPIKANPRLKKVNRSFQLAH